MKKKTGTWFELLFKDKLYKPETTENLADIETKMVTETAFSYFIAVWEVEPIFYEIHDCVLCYFLKQFFFWSILKGTNVTWLHKYGYLRLLMRNNWFNVSKKVIGSPQK